MFVFQTLIFSSSPFIDLLNGRIPRRFPIKILRVFLVFSVRIV